MKSLTKLIEAIKSSTEEKTDELVEAVKEAMEEQGFTIDKKGQNYLHDRFMDTIESFTAVSVSDEASLEEDEIDEIEEIEEEDDDSDEEFQWPDDSDEEETGPEWSHE